MMEVMKRPPVIFLGIVFCAGLISYFFSNESVSENLQKAEQFYETGERAPTVAARENAFNQALTTYLELEKQLDPDYSNGMLYYNIGNTYFQLNEIPLAIYYYYKALSLNPGNRKIQFNLGVSLRKLGDDYHQERGAFDYLFFFHSFFSLPSRLQLLFWCLVLSFIAGSYAIWKHSSVARITAWVLAAVGGLFFLSALYTQFIQTPEGVVIQSGMLHRDAGKQYAEVRSEPVASGSKVSVLAVKADGKWVKIRTESGDVGYIPSEKLKVI